MSPSSGFSLIEVLISLLILSIMLLGFDAMQIAALREARAEYFFTVAVNQLQNMRERLVVTSADNLDQQLANWNQENQEVLPQGKGEITGSFPSYTLTIFWGGQTECHTIQLGQRGCLTEKILRALP